MAGEKMGPGAIGGAGLILAALFVSAFAARGARTRAKEAVLF
jgi:hypothetical protein